MLIFYLSCSFNHYNFSLHKIDDFKFNDLPNTNRHLILRHRALDKYFNISSIQLQEIIIIIIMLF